MGVGVVCSWQRGANRGFVTAPRAEQRRDHAADGPKQQGRAGRGCPGAPQWAAPGQQGAGAAACEP